MDIWKITTVTSGGSLTFTKAPNSGTGTIDPSTGFTTAPSKGTTASSRTTVATVTLSVTLNGKTGTSGRADVYQAANSYSDSWENWTVNISADPVRIGARGGTSLLSGTAERKGIREWDSGSKEDMDDSGTPFSVYPHIVTAGRYRKHTDSGREYRRGKKRCRYRIPWRRQE